MTRYYCRGGQAITFDQLDALWRNRAYRRVRADQVPQGDVVTTWLGIDHGMAPDRPLIFETMVIGGPLDGEVTYHSSEQEAVNGHQWMLARVSASAI